MAGIVRSREAERLAQHRREMELALAEGVTILVARNRLSFRDLQAKIAASQRREIRSDGPMPQHGAVPVQSKPWMMAE